MIAARAESIMLLKERDMSDYGITKVVDGRLVVVGSLEGKGFFVFIIEAWSNSVQGGFMWCILHPASELYLVV